MVRKRKWLCPAIDQCIDARWCKHAKPHHQGVSCILSCGRGAAVVAPCAPITDPVRKTRGKTFA